MKSIMSPWVLVPDELGGESQGRRPLAGHLLAQDGKGFACGKEDGDLVEVHRPEGGDIPQDIIDAVEAAK